MNSAPWGTPLAHLRRFAGGVYPYRLPGRYACAARAVAIHPCAILYHLLNGASKRFRPRDLHGSQTIVFESALKPRGL